MGMVGMAVEMALVGGEVVTGVMVAPGVDWAALCRGLHSHNMRAGNALEYGARCTFPYPRIADSLKPAGPHTKHPAHQLLRVASE